MFDIAYNADDFFPRITAADLHALAERILSGPVTLRRCLVNQRDERRVTVILRSHESPVDQGNSHRLKVVWRDGARKDAGARLRRQIGHFGASLDGNARAPIAAGDRQPDRKSTRLNSSHLGI